MAFEKPRDGYTIYTKMNCKYCTNAKKMIPGAHVIQSDAYIHHNREKFLDFVDKMSGKRPRTFPMIFLNKRFIGGYDETKAYIDELESFHFADF